MRRDTGIMFSKQCEKTLESGEVEKLQVIFYIIDFYSIINIFQKERFDVYIVETFDICGMSEFLRRRIDRYYFLLRLIGLYHL